LKLRGVILLRLLWIAFGASLSLGLVLYLTKPPSSPLFLASLGGSTVFLFGLSTAPAAQPRALFGGHIISALIGILCYQLWGDVLWVMVFSEVVTLVALLLTRTVHPPAGANPLIMIQAHASFSVIFSVVLLSTVLLAVAAAIWSRITPGPVLYYPVQWNARSPQTVEWSIWAQP
jgi:CBS-domain-containing membrane protein